MDWYSLPLTPPACYSNLMQIQRTAVALLLWFAQMLVLAQPHGPARLAPEARLDVYGTPEVVALQQPELLQGFGTVSRIGWLRKTEQNRAFSVTFPLTLFSTNEISLRFLPRGKGIVTISLLGFYEKVPQEKEALFQEEISWEAIELQGATFTPETLGLLRFPVRSWFRQRYELGIQVDRDTPVTMRFAARPVVPPTVETPTPLENQETPAHRSAKLLAKGISLIGTSDTVKQGLGNATARSGELQQIQREGFDHVRITLPWHALAGKAPEFRVSSEALARLDLLIAEAAKHNLAVVISWHDFDAFYADPAAEAARFKAVWSQVSSHYVDFPATIAYELLNPADNQADTPSLNPIYAEVIREIRRGSLARTVLCSPGRRGNPAELARLLPPEGERNWIASLSSREPEFFSQQAFGTPALNRLSGIQFPGPAQPALPAESVAGLDLNVQEWLARYQRTPTDRNPCGPQPLLHQAQWAARWAEHYRRPVYFAELGCDSRIEPGSRARYYAAWRSALEESGLGWAVSDWGQLQRYWDGQTQQPLPGLRQALFPDRQPASAAAGNPESLQRALRQLEDLKSRLDTTERLSGKELDQLKARTSDAQRQAQQTHDLARWLMAGLLALTLVVLISLLLRRKPAAERLLALAALEESNDHRERGQKSLPPQLTEVLREKVVQRLLTDRHQDRLLHLCAAEELATLEQRLSDLQAPIEVRLNAYERKIQELEAELRQKGLENRELLETKIQLTKQRLVNVRTGADFP